MLRFGAVALSGLGTIGSLAGLLTDGCPSSELAPFSGTVALTLVADGLTSPVALVSPPDDSDRLFIVDQFGLVRLLRSGGVLQTAPFLDVRDRMIPLNPGGDERGLLGLAFHPRYADNRRLFVLYSASPGPDVPAGFACETHVSEFLASEDDRDTADAASEQILLRIPKPQDNHNAGTLAFGPDGFLYISVGDGGAANDDGFGHTPGLGNAQDLSTLLGKILRIDVDAGRPYAIPPDNPFASTPNAAPEIWAYGLRNPYRFSFDRDGDHRLFAGDVGQQLFEEVDIITRGGNYGWRIREGDRCFDRADPGTPPAPCPDTGAGGEPLIAPIISYPHTSPAGQPAGSAVIGGYVYRGDRIPGLRGKYVFGDFNANDAILGGLLFVGTRQLDGTWTRSDLQIAGLPNGRLGQFLLGFGQDASGELYVLAGRDLGASAPGAVYRLAPAD